jgi:hypothetical protein
LAGPLYDRPQRLLPEDTGRAEAVQVGKLVECLGAERADHLHSALPHGGVIVTERREVNASAQVGRLIIAHLGPHIADRELEPREPALIIETWGRPTRRRLRASSHRAMCQTIQAMEFRPSGRCRICASLNPCRKSRTTC